MTATGANIRIECPSTILKENVSWDCVDILQSYNLHYTEMGSYLLVGSIPPIQGWILYISCIRLHFSPLLKNVLPPIVNAEVGFMIPCKKEIVREILNGSPGQLNVGKIICIYSQDVTKLVSLADILIHSTTDFRGPAVPESIHLGGCLYTKFDVFPAENFNENNAALPSTDHPKEWPFSSIFPLPKPPAKPLWNNRYRTLAIIKPDPKGRVIQANYFKSLFSIKLCIIKEGVKNMWADEFGRDIVDRINWQYELYRRLEGHVLTPKIFDRFEEQGNVYLAMDFIKGDSLKEKVHALHLDNSWLQLPLINRSMLLRYLIEILKITDKLHKIGYVHRDITPANFIIDKKQRIHLIDMELTYSIADRTPFPPFKLGTPGYFSPQQAERQEPTIQEDIYALGALMIFIFCRIDPARFNLTSYEKCYGSILFFTGSTRLATLISRCLSKEPESRPGIDNIIESIICYKDESEASLLSTQRTSPLRDSADLTQVINNGLRALGSEKVLSPDGLWTTPKNAGQEVPITARESQLSFFSGSAGILFLLAKAKRLGYDIAPCLDIYYRNYDHLRTQLLTDTSLYTGSAGYALAIKEGIDAGLLSETELPKLTECFSQIQTDRLDIAFGLTGQGLSLLNCQGLLDDTSCENKLHEIVGIIVKKQSVNGSWPATSIGRKKSIYLGLYNGISGILCFLIKYCQKYKNDQVFRAIQKALYWLKEQASLEKDTYRWSIIAKRKSVDNSSIEVGIPGVALTYINAFQLFDENEYRAIAENALRPLPANPILDDFSQISGLAGLGEVYLKASTVFNSSEWFERLTWISNFFYRTYQIEPEFGYWAVDTFTDPRIELMTGTSGILHFLMRSQNQQSQSIISI